MKKIYFWCFALFMNTVLLQAQNTPVCSEMPLPGADHCPDACVHCTLDGFAGNTAGFTAGAAPGFCSTTDNEQWLGFIAGSDSISISVAPANCQQGNGLEIALYADCTGAPLACAAGQAGDGTVTRILNSALTPGQTYFLMIDGYEGDQCAFTIGTGPAGAVAVPLPDSAGAVQGPTIVAGGSSITYMIPPVQGATAYQWSGPSHLKINGQTPPVTLPAAGGNQVTVTFGTQNGGLCVTPVNPCGNGTASCLGFAIGTTLPPPCPASDTPAADLCEEVCIYCNFNGYSGSTSGYTGQTPPGFCGTIENEQWLGFIAGAAAATFTATPSNCTTGNGVQIALYPSCDGPPIQCNGGWAGGGDTPVSITASLTPGVSYFLLIDGYAADQCDFQLSVVPPSAMQAPGIGSTGVISGPANVCPGGTVTFSIPPVSGAGAYNWLAPPGWRINGQFAPVSLVGAGSNVVEVTAGGASSGQICVQPVNSCAAGSQVCKNVTVSAIPITLLPIVTVCAEDVPYQLPWGDLCYNSGNYETTLTSYQGCDSIVRQKVVIYAPIIVNLGIQFFCTGDSVVVCGEAFNALGSYSKPCTSYQGCDSVINFSIIEFDPVANIIPGAVNCTLPPVTFNSLPSPGVKLWKDINGQVVGNGNTLTVNDPGVYILEVNATIGGNICTAIDTVTVLFGTDIPVAGALAGDTLTCVQTTVPLDGSADIPNALFAWSGPGGFTSILEDPVVGAPGQYVLTVTNPESGCSSQAMAEVPADILPPEVQLSSGIVSCATPSVQIESITPTAGALFDWSGPDGFTSPEQQPFTGIPGLYTAIVTNPSNGCTATAEITVPGDTLPPSAAATGGTLTCAILSVQLSCTTDAATPDFLWQGPAGFSSTEQNPAVNVPGQYTVTVTAANGCTTTAIATALENTQPPVVETTGDTLRCAQPFVNLVCNASAVQAGFAWIGPGFSSAEQNPVVTAAGVYTVTVTDAGNGCSSTAEALIILDDDLPEVLIAIPDILTCVQQSVLLESSTTVTQPVYHWIGPNGFTSGLPAATAETPGVYVLTVTDTATGCAGAAQIMVLENTALPGAAVSGAGTITCAQPVLLLNGSSPVSGAEYQWLVPDEAPVAGPVLPVSLPGLYVLVVTDPGNGCISTASALVSQDTEHPAVSLHIDTITCRSDSLFIGVTDPQNYQFSWTGPNGFTSVEAGFWINIPEIGVYAVTVTNPGNGCTQILQADEFIQNLTQPVISPVLITNDQFGQHIGAIDIEISYPGAVTVAWYRDGVLLSNQEDITGLPAGTYTVVVTADDNGCTTSQVLAVSNIIVSTDTAPADDFWEVFPNPANTHLQLRYTGPDRPETRVMLTDVAGRIVFEQTTLPTPFIKLSVEFLPSGMYRLLIQTKNATLWRSVVIQR